MSRIKTANNLHRRVLLIVVFAVSSIVMLFVSLNDLSKIVPAGAAEEITLVANTSSNTESLVYLANKTPNQFSAGENNRVDDFSKSIAKLEEYLVNEGIANDYGIYFQDLNNEKLVYTHDETRTFRPASIYKVPLAVVSLKNSQDGKYSLDDKTAHEGELKPIREVIDVMIMESNNDSMAILENKNGGYAKTQEQITNELNGTVVKRRGQVTSAVDIAKVFTILHDKDNNYLTEENREYLINLMINAEARHRDRIPAAVDEFNNEHGTSLTAATKIGNLIGTYEDAGIIMGVNSDYVIILLNHNKLTNTEAINEIKDITKILLEEIE